jgi:hypothetical protein
MTELIKRATLRNVPFWVCLCISIALIVAGFCVPPTGVIDGSVLTGVGELFGFAALWTVWLAIKNGTNAKVRHGKTSLIVGTSEKDGKPNPQYNENDEVDE